MKKLTEKDFEELSSEAKRIAIAKDVIKQCKNNNKIKIKTGEYFYINDAKYDEVLNSKSGKTQFNKCLPDLKCSVCALGGLFYSAVMLGDKFKLQQSERSMHFDDRAFSSKLKSYFNIGQLRLIEAAFEKGDGWSGDGPNLLKAVKFGRKNGKSKARLIAIMKNIIKNNGEFIP